MTSTDLEVLVENVSTVIRGFQVAPENPWHPAAEPPNSRRDILIIRRGFHAPQVGWHSILGYKTYATKDVSDDDMVDKSYFVPDVTFWAELPVIPHALRVANI